ncbi:MAG: nucleotidyltransferase family protein [Candidatus Omnitrophica bacterium]|nr:nucleotidyltransferase family protein [Candidatus Omnitrophota bacterium]
MKVILLCAGYATRLYPLTKNQPKSLLPLAGGQPILEWILDCLKPISQIEEVYIVTNHRFAGNFETWKKTAKYPWPIKVVDDKTTTNENRLGAIGDLSYVLETQKIGACDLMVVAGDNLFDFDLMEFYRKGQANRPHAAIAVYDVKDKTLAKQYGLARLNDKNQVLEFLEKPENPPTTLASCGIYWLPAETRVLLDRFLAQGNNADQPGHYMKWLAQSDKLFAISLQGNWFDIGDLTSYEKAKEFSSRFRKPSMKK